MYRFNAIPTKTPMTFFTKREKSTLKFMWKHRRQRVKAILSKKSSARGITIPGFKLYCRPTTAKIVQHWFKNRHVDQWNRIEDPEINPHCYKHLILNKRAKNMLEKRHSLQQAVFGNLYFHI
jgi:hypothetical protein